MLFYFYTPRIHIRSFGAHYLGVMYMKSLWQATSKLPKFDRLEQDAKTEVLIIGGGLSGILCAYMLGQAGIPYLLVEANRICGGVSADTTAKITSQHGLIYDRLFRQFGLKTAKLYYLANQGALNRYRQMCRDIDCCFSTADAYVYATDKPKKLEQEWKTLLRMGVPADFLQTPSLPFSTVGAIRFAEQAQFHPLQFVAAIAKDLRIYEHTPIRSFDGKVYRTDRGKITANKTIVATHFPIWNKHGAYFLKLYQHRSYVLALENAAPIEGMYVDAQETGLSFRSFGDLLLLGGGSHRTGKNGGGWNALENFVPLQYPQAKIKYRWATQDCMSLDGVPYIGEYAAGTPNLFVATGFNKWGMTSSMVAATVLCDLVQGKQNPYASVFSPSRSILRPQLVCNTWHSVSGLLTPTVPRCPHMGCALHWNRQEHSWDCPCHGSRFAQDGTPLDNPANGDLKNKK